MIDRRLIVTRICIDYGLCSLNYVNGTSQSFTTISDEYLIKTTPQQQCSLICSTVTTTP